MTLNQGASRTYSSVVAGKWFGKLMEGGVPPKTIESRSHVRLEQLENVDGRIPLPDFQRLIQCSYDLLEDEAMALHVGAAANLSKRLQPPCF